MAIEILTLSLDGVIFDTEDMQLAACNAAFERCALELRWSLRHLREAARVRGATNALGALIERLSLSPTGGEARGLQREKDRAFHDLAAAGGATVDPACMRLMEEALERGCKLAVVTDMPVQTATALLERSFGNAVTNMFAVVVSGADFSQPAAQGPHGLVLRTVGAEASNCVAIDAAVPGLRAAQQAGIWTMAATPYEKDIARITGADMWCPQLQELRDLTGMNKAPHAGPAKYLCFDALYALKARRTAVAVNQVRTPRLAA